jgi:DNA polymerase-3 subunit epsilon
MAQPILQRPLAFVDIETTGFSPASSRVLEVGVVRVENGRVVRQFQTLVHPGQPVSFPITRLTGITTQMTTRAPRFEQIAAELTGVLDGAIFVAHNVSFDYGFIKAEYSRLQANFAPAQLCTVRLSRALYPGASGHKLQDLISRHQLKTANRHRAYDDAEALWQFFQIVQVEFGAEAVEAAMARQLSRA